MELIEKLKGKNLRSCIDALLIAIPIGMNILEELK